MGARRRRINKELVGGPSAPADEESGGSSQNTRRSQASSKRQVPSQTPLFVTLVWALVAAVAVFALGRLVFA